MIQGLGCTGLDLKAVSGFQGFRVLGFGLLGGFRA